MTDARETMHATLILIGEQGILIAGRSGHGKSSLALALLARARALGLHARLVGDDRISLRVLGRRLIGSGHDLLKGRIEARGLGILEMEAADAAIVRRIVTLEDNPPRLPEDAARTMDILGIPTRHLTLRTDHDLPAKADLVLCWLDG
jgi:HPr kinase/phosphorylase